MATNYAAKGSYMSAHSHKAELSGSGVSPGPGRVTQEQTTVGLLPTNTTPDPGVVSFSKGVPHDPSLGIPLGHDLANVPLGSDYGLARGIDQHPSNGALYSKPPRLVAVNEDAPNTSKRGPAMLERQLPLPPAIGSPELIGEVAELYALALLRDVPLTCFRHDGVSSDYIADTLDALNDLSWFRRDADFNLRDASAALRRRVDFGRQTAFRGIAPGDDTGPYLSQLLLVGDTGVNNERAVYEGLISHGARTVSQRVRKTDAEDFLMSWDAWLAAQDGRPPFRSESYDPTPRFISTGRDLATYVRFESYCQPYINAGLLLAAHQVPVEPALSSTGALDEPRILSLIANVADRALDAVRAEKLKGQHRLRPEELAARLYRAGDLHHPGLVSMRDTLLDNPIGTRVLAQTERVVGEPSMLLPMAYANGAPHSPGHGSAHAAVAGACVTILKALFDHTAPFTAAGSGSDAFVVSDMGDQLQRVAVFDPFGNRATISVEGELNKLLANIGLGRCWAGVQYFSSYWESALLGEDIAIEALEELAAGLPTNYEITVPRLDGGLTRI